MTHRYAGILRLTAVLAVGLFLLPGCGKVPEEPSDTSSALTTASTTAPVTVPTADPRYTGSRDSDGVQVDWDALPSPSASAPADTKMQQSLHLFAALQQGVYPA